MAWVAGMPAAMMRGIAATARFARFEKSTFASTQILPPITAMRLNRYISIPPCTLTGMLRTSAPNIGMKPSRMAKTAATTNTMIEKTRVMPMTPMFSAYVVSPVPPSSPLMVVPSPSPMNVRPSMWPRSRFMTPLMAYTCQAFSATRMTGMKKNRLSVVPNWLKTRKLNASPPRMEARPMAMKATWPAHLAAAHGRHDACVGKPVVGVRRPLHRQDRADEREAGAEIARDLEPCDEQEDEGRHAAEEDHGVGVEAENQRHQDGGAEHGHHMLQAHEDGLRPRQPILGIDDVALALPSSHRHGTPSRKSARPRGSGPALS